MIDLKYLVNISSRKKYALMIRESFLNLFKSKFKKMKHEELIILYIKSFKQHFNEYILSHLGEVGGSVDAEAYKFLVKIKDKQLYCALKLIPLINSESSKIMDLNYKSWKELYILKMVYNLIKNHNCPNVPIIYLYFICTNCKSNDYLNPNIIKYYNNLTIRKKIQDDKSKKDIFKRMEKKKGFGTNSLCILNELCDSSLKDILTNNYIEKINDTMFHSFIFQILSGIYSIHKICNICHFDLHGGNILISNIESNGYWLYSINNNDYYIPNYGYILKVWDFGRSMILYTDDFVDICSQIIHQCKRFYKEPFKKNPKLEKKIFKKLNKTNIKIILFAFDIWRIISYLYSKFKKDNYLSIKFKTTLELLANIKKDCENNWVHLMFNANEISNTPEIFMKYLLDKYFNNYTNPSTPLINKKKYCI
tara:strand:- start:1075 stop:2340 length:1266 start_codon:yes stop_codon:yes gene_type:complete